MPRLLRSLSNQDYDGDWELVVVLDGPDEPSESLLQGFVGELPLRVIVRAQNGGVAAAMQEGISAARGRIIIRCDDDLEPGRDFISAHMRHHLPGTPVGVIGPTRDVFPDTAYARVYGRPANARSLESAYARPADQRWIGWAANNSAPKAMIDSVGGFDTSLWYGEDSELGFRMHEAGLPFVVDQALEVQHHGPSTSVASRAARAYVSGASRAAFELRHPGRSHATGTTAVATPWTRAVDLVATRLRTRDDFARAGRRVDAVLGVVPTAIAEKLVALLVEAGGRSGHDHGHQDLSSFTAQKDSELAQEMAHVAHSGSGTNDPRQGISVIIPHYGDPTPTRELVGMLEQQTDAPPIQIIVVDDKSPDPIPSAGSADIVYRDINGGYGSAINSGARHAVHDSILILNSDLEIDNSFVADLARESAPHMPAVVSPDIVDETGTTQWPARHFPTTSQHFVVALGPLARFRSSNWWHEAVGHDTRARRDAVVNVDWVVGAVMLLPTQDFRAVHGFDEGFFMNSEEVDLQRRLRARGLPSVFLGTVRAQHESGGSSDPSLRRGWVISSALRYAQKWGERPLLLRLALTVAAVLNFGANAARQLSGRDVDALGSLRREFGYALLPTRRQG